MLWIFKVCDKCPVRSPKDHLLLTVGAEVYKVSPDPDALLPYLIKDNPLLPVVYNQRIKISIDTKGLTTLVYATLNALHWSLCFYITDINVSMFAGWEDWISTGLYLSPGMKTYIAIPPSMVEKGWQVLYILR